MPLMVWTRLETKRIYRAAVEKFIPIPQIKVTDNGAEEYVFLEFDLDLSKFDHALIKNEVLIQSLENPLDRRRIKGDAIDFEGYEPKRVILSELRRKPEIDYEKCSALLFRLISQVCGHYADAYGENGMRNIVMMFRRDIAGKIYDQMMQHFYCRNGFLVEEIIGVRGYNLEPTYSVKQRCNLYDSYSGDIRSIVFDGIRKGVFDRARFDSDPELRLARNLETDESVLNWLRPAPNEFNISYNRGQRYQPDFVIETEDVIYLTEVKRADMMTDPDVLSKKERGTQ